MTTLPPPSMPPAAPAKKSHRKRNIALLIGGGVLGLGAIGSALSPPEEETDAGPEKTTVAELEATTVAVETTEAPVITEAPETTPEPTDPPTTPAPTTPPTTAAPDIPAFAIWMTTGPMIETFSSLSEVSFSISDHLDIGDVSGAADLAFGMSGDLSEVYAEAIVADDGSVLATKTIDMLDVCAAAYLSSGVALEALDVDAMEASIGEIQECNAKMGEVTAVMETMSEALD